MTCVYGCHEDAAMWCVISPMGARNLDLNHCNCQNFEWISSMIGTSKKHPKSWWTLMFYFRACPLVDSVMCVTRLIHMCDMTHSYVRHDSFICVTWLIHMCDMTHSYVWHDSFICVTWLIHMCDMTHSYVWHDSFIFATWLIHICVTWLINICVTYHMHMC